MAEHVSHVWTRLALGRPRIPITERISRNTERTADGCLTWTGALTRDGYGKVTVPRDGENWANGQRTVHAHRLAWELRYGVIPDGLVVDHMCANRRCCETTHLRLATPRQNTFAEWSNCLAKLNAQKTHCIHGHPLSGDNLIVYLSRGTVARACRECQHIGQRRYNERKKGIA